MSTSAEDKNVDEILHQTQINRAKELIVTVKTNQRYAVYMSKVFWYFCHVSALIGWASGFSIAGTAISNTEIGKWLTVLLSLLTAIYPLSKYLDLEGRRTRFNHLSLYCKDLVIKLEDSVSLMEGIVKDGFDPSTEGKRWDEMITFITLTSTMMEKLEIGSDDFQKSLADFGHSAQKPKSQRAMLLLGARKSS
jgi:hypothetical protein